MIRSLLSPCLKPGDTPGGVSPGGGGGDGGLRSSFPDRGNIVEQLGIRSYHV
jgi:hypothetical protein